MGILVGTIGALSTFYPDAKNIFDLESRRLQTRRLIGKLPTLAAFAYRHRPFIGHQLRARQQGQPEAVRRIAWKAQQRLHRLYRRLQPRKKHQQVVVAVAREMVGFLWAIDRALTPVPTQ
jgi:hypothetical protein